MHWGETKISHWWNVKLNFRLCGSLVWTYTHWNMNMLGWEYKKFDFRLSVCNHQEFFSLTDDVSRTCEVIPPRSGTDSILLMIWHASSVFCTVSDLNNNSTIITSASKKSGIDSKKSTISTLYTRTLKPIPDFQCLINCWTVLNKDIFRLRQRLREGVI